ncbi:hypothetical protein [Algoriphagus taiwanensis]|uniref:Uncharacterized protein n=1 Tax=Algoriphagus taiwanensis TaxID=1445656 RepID=A0ABQ6Q0X1_9BACT|nr:hypothetical protein Ataiwa_14470 [Algoriphagus taiwanensis]
MPTSIPDSEFSITRGGLLYKFLRGIGVILPEKPSILRQILFFTLFSYLPLLVLSLVEGLHLGNKVEVPFLVEFASAIRFLLVIPLLLVSEVIVDKRVKLTLNQFERSNLLSESGKAKFEAAKLDADRLGESIWGDLVIILLILSYLLFRIHVNSVEMTTWAYPNPADPSEHSLAGIWAAYVSYPIFQFMILRWIWRWIIWSRMMRKISRADLAIITTHPDQSGGLGFLGEPPMPFSIFTLALSIVFSGIMAERVIFQGLHLHDHYPLIALFAILCILINLLPLIHFITILNKARIKGIYDYHALISRHHREFEKKWISSGKTTPEEILGSPDASSAADIQAVYEAVKKMTPYPFNLKSMVATLVLVLFPLLFVFALEIPLLDLLKKLAGIFF